MLTPREIELLKMLEELSTAAFRRDTSLGDPIRTMDARSELNTAREKADELIQKMQQEKETCLCGGKTKYYHGALGYEAFVCESCGEHWNDHTTEDHAKHLAQYTLGERRN